MVNKIDYMHMQSEGGLRSSRDKLRNEEYDTYVVVIIIVLVCLLNRHNRGYFSFFATINKFHTFLAETFIN